MATASQSLNAGQGKGLRISLPEGPIGPKWQAFVLAGEPGWFEHVGEITFAGAVGTGKTRALVSSLILTAVKYPGSQLALIRDTRTNLERSTLNTFWAVAGDMRAAGLMRHVKRDNKIIVQEPGKPASEIYLFGVDHPDFDKSIVGAEFFRVYVDQAERIREEVIDLLLTRIRQKVYDAEGELAANHMKLTANMDEGRRSWLFRRYEVGSVEIGNDIYYKRVERVIDGKRYVGHRMFIRARFGENKSLHPEYGRFLALAGSTASGFIADEWEKNYDLVFPEYEPSMHQVPHLEDMDYASYDAFVGLDFGTSSPAVALVFMRHRKTGVVYAVAELVERGLSARDFGADIGNLLHRFRSVRDIFVYADPALWDNTGHSKTIAEEIYDELVATLRRRVYFDPAATKGTKDIDASSSSIIKDMLADGRLKFTGEVPMLMDVMSSITWADVRANKHPMNDIFDALKYALRNLPDAEQSLDEEEEGFDVRPNVVRFWGYA